MDLNSLSLPERSKTQIEAALSMIHADWLDRTLKVTECCRKLFDAIAGEMLAVGSVRLLQDLESIPGVIFDIAVQKRWYRIEARPPGPRLIARFAGIEAYPRESWLPSSGGDWFGDRTRDWWGRGTMNSGSRPTPPRMAELGDHTVLEDFTVRFRASLAGRIEFWRGKATYGATGGGATSEAVESAPLPATAVAAVSGETDARQQGQRVFRREGEYWTIAFEGATVRLRHSQGLQYLSYLVKQPDREFYAFDLVTAMAGGQKPLVRGSAGEVLDHSAMTAYKDRAESIQDELAEAKTHHNIGRVESLQREYDHLVSQLLSGTGLGGRARSVGDNAERARKAVSVAVRRAIKQVRAVHKGLAAHLEARVSQGAFLSYRDDGIGWNC